MREREYSIFQAQEPLPAVSTSGITPQPQVSAFKRFLRRMLAGFLSLLIPGLGQAFNREWKLALAFIAFYLVLSALFSMSRLLLFFWGFCIYATLNIGILLAAAGHAFWRGSEGRESSGSVWVKACFATLSVALATVTMLYERPADFLGVRSLRTPSDSMSPTLQVGDRFVVDLRAYARQAPQRGDLVIFVFRKGGPEPVVYAKRVIAIGGDTIQVIGPQVMLNNQVLTEPYLERRNERTLEKVAFGPMQIPPGQLFVAGDNRANSYDSRYFGLVQTSDVLGKLAFIYWSPSRERIGKELE